MAGYARGLYIQYTLSSLIILQKREKNKRIWEKYDMINPQLKSRNLR
jgi:hypothetical protein